MLMLTIPLAGCLENFTGSEDDDSVITEINDIIEGCTDANAVNYDTNATDDDGSCMIATAKQFLESIMGANPLSAIEDSADNRAGLEIHRIQDSGVDGWASDSRSVLVDPSSGDLIVSVEEKGMDKENQTHSKSLTTVISGDTISYRNSGSSGVRTADGTYVAPGGSRSASYGVISGLISVASILEPDRQPTCKEIYGPQSMGTWPACYESSTTSASSSTSGRGGGNGWAVGMYEYEACELEGGTWVNTDPDPVGNPNVGYCIWQMAPIGVQSVFMDGANSNSVNYLESMISESQNMYVEDENGNTMTFMFGHGTNSDDTWGLTLVITLDDEKRLVAYESVYNDGENNIEGYSMHYTLTSVSKDENGENLTSYTRANPGGGYVLELPIEKEGFYWYECPPLVMMPLDVNFYPGASTTPTEWCEARFGSASGGVSGSGNGVTLYLTPEERGFYWYDCPPMVLMPLGVASATEWCEDTFGTNSGGNGGNGVQTVTQLREQVADQISNGALSPSAISLKFVCDDGTEIWLGATQDGIDDCANGEDETFDTESGVSFVISDSQILRPELSSFEIRFISDESSDIENATILQTIPLEGESDETTEARAADDGGGDDGGASTDDDDSDSREPATAVYTDSDGDGRISPGDSITLSFSTDETALMFDKTARHHSALLLGEDSSGASGGLGTRDMTCEEQSDNQCTVRWSVWDDVTGSYIVHTWCELKAEGYDCDGNPEAVES